MVNTSLSSEGRSASLTSRARQGHTLLPLSLNTILKMYQCRKARTQKTNIRKKEDHVHAQMTTAPKQEECRHRPGVVLRTRNTNEVTKHLNKQTHAFWVH